MKQIYENYTIEDQEVWKILFDRQINQLEQVATVEFINGLKKIRFTANRIPDFDQTNQLLKTITGWELQAVPGIVDDSIFFELLANRKFPATTWLRKKSQLDYLEEPDMFHDVFAHVPLLANQPFVDFLESLSKIALEHIENPWAIHLLSRVYWFTVEFGLIREEGQKKIYGAGILSSVGETEYSLGDKPQHFEYDVKAVLNASYRKDIYQAKYFIIDRYETLFNSIDAIRDELKAILEKPEPQEFSATSN